jgi:hypothetical protein
MKSETYVHKAGKYLIVPTKMKLANGKICEISLFITKNFINTGELNEDKNKFGHVFGADLKELFKSSEAK